MASDQAYVKDPRVDEYIRAAARVAAGDLCAGPRHRALGRRRGRRDDQALGAAVFRAGGQHLCAARDEGPRERIPLRRRHRPRPGGDHHRRPREQDGAADRDLCGLDRSTSARCDGCSSRSSPTTGPAAGASSSSSVDAVDVRCDRARRRDVAAPRRCGQGPRSRYTDARCSTSRWPRPTAHNASSSPVRSARPSGR